MLGKRYPDGAYVEEPGGYSKHVVAGEVCWMVKPPNGGAAFHIGRRNADGSAYHWIQEHEDGTITVQPEPPDAPVARRNSNSILGMVGRDGQRWHGYIYQGVWRAV